MVIACTAIVIVTINALSAFNGVASYRRAELQPYSETPVYEICTYFEPLGMDEGKDNKTREMLDIWRESWTNNGWSTRVLTSKDAALHPRYKSIEETLLKLPTINNQVYEMSCYLRWVAAIATGCTVRIPAVLFQLTRPKLTIPAAVDVRSGHGQLRLSRPAPLEGRQAL